MSSRSAFITLAHGGGGRLQNELIRQEIASRFTAPELSALPDAAVTAEGLVISSDSFVISPRFFRGGDIGKLAVAGTVNDILVSGGIPQYMTCSLIIEEGLPLDELRRILDSMQQTAVAGNTAIITGDTKEYAVGSRIFPTGRSDHRQRLYRSACIEHHGGTIWSGFRKSDQ